MTAFADTCIVAIVGPRQSGKTTLACQLAARDGREFVSLDEEASLRFAASDPAGFMRGIEIAAIDEIQRAPNLVLAIKKSVDEDQRPGRYLITGSVDFFKSMITPDSLAGRVEVVELLPFSQTETRKIKVSSFLARAFANDFPGRQHTGFTENLTEMVLTGGYPRSFLASNMRRKQSMLRTYVEFLATRDLPEIIAIKKNPASLLALVELIVATSGCLVNLSRLAAGLHVNIKTVDRWLVLLERMFLVRRIRAWHCNRTKRLVGAPKLHFIDSGVLAAMREADEKLLATDRQQLASLLETFVFSEIAKAVPHFDSPLRISHYRDKDGYEVDFVLETYSGKTVGIEVKSATTVYPNDFRGLRRLADAAGTKFACGIVFADNDRILRVDDRMFAMPIKMLWEE